VHANRHDTSPFPFSSFPSLLCPPLPRPCLCVIFVTGSLLQARASLLLSSKHPPVSHGPCCYHRPPLVRILLLPISPPNHRHSSPENRRADHTDVCLSYVLSLPRETQHFCSLVDPLSSLTVFLGFSGKRFVGSRISSDRTLFFRIKHHLSPCPSATTLSSAFA
jgi:hypothetical protein